MEQNSQQNVNSTGRLVKDNIEMARQAGANQNIFSPLVSIANNPHSPQPQSNAKNILMSTQNGMSSKFSQGALNSMIDAVNNGRAGGY